MQDQCLPSPLAPSTAALARQWFVRQILTEALFLVDVLAMLGIPGQ
jgi:hypothetical protein